MHTPFLRVFFFLSLILGIGTWGLNISTCRATNDWRLSRLIQNHIILKKEICLILARFPGYVRWV